MQPVLQELASIFSQTTVYKVPRYQRTYQWTPSQWQGLARDIAHIAVSPGDERHFVGIVLLAENRPGPRVPGRRGPETFDVIDGQQRLITLSVWLAALAAHAAYLRGDDPLVSAADARSSLASIEVASLDELPYEDAMSGQWAARVAAKTQPSSALLAYHYYRWILWLGQDALASDDPIDPPVIAKCRWWNGANWEELFQGYLDRARAKDADHPDRSSAPDITRLYDRSLASLQFITIQWDDRNDEPQAEIFEALNGMRTELRQLDHVRNRVFLRLTPVAGDRIFRDDWQPTEVRLLRTTHKGLRTDPGSQFLYDFLISEGERSVSRARAAAQLDQYSRKRHLFGQERLITETLVPAMGCWIAVAETSNSLAWGKGAPRALPPGAQPRLQSIRFFSISSDPLLLRLLRVWSVGDLDDPSLIDALELVDAFWARHILAGTNLSPYRAKFMGYMAQLGSSVTPSGIRSTLEFPSDAAVLAGIELRQLYARLRPDQVLALLRGVERGLNPVGAHPMPGGRRDEEYTVEHIAPQQLDRWAADMRRWGVARDAYGPVLHTLGNLTAATNSHNKSVGRSKLNEKQARLNREPPLGLNRDWRTLRKWRPLDIRHRSNTLAQAALRYWSLP